MGKKTFFHFFFLPVAHSFSLKPLRSPEDRGGGLINPS